MIKIENHISEALLKLNRLTISGIGSLTLLDQPFTLDEKLNTVFPKRKRIIFNQFLSSSDGKFESYLQEHLKISIEEIKKAIEEFAIEVNDKINNNEDYEIADFGVFHKSSSGHIDFKLIEFSKINIDTFGLTPVSAVLLNDETDQKSSEILNEEVKVPSVQPEVISELVSKEPETILPEEKNIDSELEDNQTIEVSEDKEEGPELTTAEEPKPESIEVESVIIEKTAEEKLFENPEDQIQKPKKKKRSWLKKIILVLFLAAIGAWIVINQDMIKDVLNKKKSDSENIVLNEEKNDKISDSSESKDTLESEVITENSDAPITTQDSNQTEIEKAPVKETEKKQPASNNTVAPEGNFNIIVGTFKDKMNADRQLKKLRDMGLNPIIIEKGTTLYVASGSYSTRAEADINLKKIQETEYSGAWILKK